MSQDVKGTFICGGSVNIGETSDVLMIPTGTTTMRFSTVGLDANNTVKTQKSTNNGHTWADQTTYNSDQTLTAVTVAAGEQWRLFHVSGQAQKDIRYAMSAQS